MRIRLTAQRRAVLEVIQQSADHPTAGEIFQRVQALHPGLAYGTVYTALRALVTEGLIHELKFGDGASRYDGRLEEHHHALCLGCGALAEVPLKMSAQQLAAVARETGFELRGHHIQFTGYCAACQAKRI
ncbi:MAG: Fur family transcriptional regulator [Firmicutes bacterium]|nr:Fur family transcriptional regulator [Bacillota bacterium]